MAVIGVEDQPVVAQRQVAGKLEGGLTDHLSVDVAGRFPVVHLVGVALATVLKAHHQPGGAPVVHMQVDIGHGPGTRHGDGRQHGAPGLVAACGQRAVDGVGTGCIDAHSAEHGDHRGVVHLGVTALPVPELRGDPILLGELRQSGVTVRHGPIPPEENCSHHSDRPDAARRPKCQLSTCTEKPQTMAGNGHHRLRDGWRRPGCGPPCRARSGGDAGTAATGR